MTPLRGRCPAGQCLAAKAPRGHRKTLTFVAALRCDGICASCLLNQPINAVSFRAYVEQFLVPTLRPGDVVVLDNLSSREGKAIHKGKAIRKAIQAAGAELILLPPYSSDLNPIERVFAKLKTLLQKDNARTIKAVTEAIAKLLNEYTVEECANHLVNPGCGSTLNDRALTGKSQEVSGRRFQMDLQLRENPYRAGLLKFIVTILKAIKLGSTDSLQKISAKA